MLEFLGGTVVGSIFGVVFMSLLQINKISREKEE